MRHVAATGHDPTAGQLLTDLPAVPVGEIDAVMRQELEHDRGPVLCRCRGIGGGAGEPDQVGGLVAAGGEVLGGEGFVVDGLRAHPCLPARSLPAVDEPGERAKG